MTRWQLLRRSFQYHWRGNLLVLLGVAVGMAVLTGALLVGDSLRGSLRDKLERNLSWIDQVMVTNRFFRQSLARSTPAGRACPALVLRGSATGPAPIKNRVGPVMILGIDDRFFDSNVIESSFWMSEEKAVVLNAPLANALGVAAGDSVVLQLLKTSAIPRESLLGRRDSGSVIESITVTVRAILPAESPGSEFSLSPTPEAPLNAFLPLKTLQDHLGQEGRVNAIFAQGRDPVAMRDALAKNLSLDDWGLMLQTPVSRTDALFAKLDRDRDGKLSAAEHRRRVGESFLEAADRDKNGQLDRTEVLGFFNKERAYISLESRRMLLEPSVATLALECAKSAGLRAAPTMVYLANGIGDGKSSIPYSVVAALDPSLPLPLGPLMPPSPTPLGDDEILLVDWKDSPLKAEPGQPIALQFFDPEVEGKIVERSATFRLRGKVPLTGPALDPDLTPEFPGITDKLDIKEWDPPFPYDNKRVRRPDEHYWDVYRTTPKAYVTLNAGQKLWNSRFGDLTSIRLAPSSATPADLENAAQAFGRELLGRLSPADGGFVFDAIRERGLEASAQGTDFGGLFAGFSSFLIGAAMLLIALLVRLNLDRRAPEIGLLLALGFSRPQVRRLWLAEGAGLAVAGSLIGLVGAVGYAWLLLEHLRFWWPGAMDRGFLRLHVEPMSLCVGFAISFAVSIASIFWAVRGLKNAAPVALLRGDSLQGASQPAASPTSRRGLYTSLVSGVLAIVLLASGGKIHDPEMRAGCFFGSGMMLLTCLLAVGSGLLKRSRRLPLAGHDSAALSRLGIRNAARYPLRSLLTAGLIASATFLVVAVESFHRVSGADFLDKQGGSGGFSLLVETDVPLFAEPGSAQGQEDLGFSRENQAALKDVEIVPLRRRGGDDTSCLNLYQPRQPRLVGVSRTLVDRGGFSFKESEAKSAEEKANSWLLLDRNENDAIPVFGEANTVLWMLRSGLGKEVKIVDEAGKEARLRIVGLLHDSVFQGELLMAEDNLLKLFPRQEGYQVFLVAAPPERQDTVAAALANALADYGCTVTPTRQRLEAYLAVENTYLSTFQTLGGLGLMLGALGLGIVLMRAVIERRGELALLRALGYPGRSLRLLVLSENSFLLLVGLFVGAVSALAAVAPHLLEAPGALPWLRWIVVLAAVFFVGMAAAAVAVRIALRAPLLQALRRE